jgi:hypothetical protein
MANETHGMRAGAVVCGRCGSYGDHMSCHEGRDGERIWFCARCIDPRHDAPSVTGA